jgi:uncharacterized protein YjiS (DUF1127 family)
MTMDWRAQPRVVALYPFSESNSPTMRRPDGAPVTGPSAAPARAAMLPVWARRIAAALHWWRGRAGTRSELPQLSDHLLYNIGLTRAEASYEWTRPSWDFHRCPTFDTGRNRYGRA